MGYLSSLERALFVKEGLWHKSREPPVSLPFTFESAKDYSHALLSLVLDEAREHVLSGLIQSKGDIDVFIMTQSLKITQRPVGH